MSRLVAVSNRVGPVRGAALAGGLAVALVDALRHRRGLWFGWSGHSRDAPDTAVKLNETGTLVTATLDLSTAEYESYYNGFSNRCLWPLCHFRADLIHYDRAEYAAYLRANARFARALAPLLKTDDVIWVHDYHLIPFASALRALGARNRIGFFLHVPFPPRDILAALAEHAALARALGDYDLLGFQTDSDLERFEHYFEREHGARIARAGVSAVSVFGRTLSAGAFPIGIDTRQVRDFAFSKIGAREFQRMRAALNGRAQAIGVDRLDYSKGLLRRMDAVEELLGAHPQTHSQIQYLQVAPISRGELKAYRDFRRDLNQRAARINGRFGRYDWMPVHYLNRPIPRRALAGLYRASRIGLVTPIRDGMNLVAKEYVAAQDPDDPGVLVLSRFAGAAQQMEAALQVNPYDTAAVAGALLRAWTMPLAERRERHGVLLEGLMRNDARHWADSFLHALTGAAPASIPVSATTLPAAYSRPVRRTGG
jgi:trehalose 6-phosphate synthase